jgi:hypothetical protein
MASCGIPVNAPTLLAQNDIYHSVNPLRAGVVDDSNVKVARATTPDGKDPGADTNQVSTNVPVALPATDPGTEKEVRKAEAVRPMDLPDGAPVMTLPPPKPADF